MRLKKVLYNIHLWLGLVTGAVVFFVSTSAALYLFEPEISQLLEQGVYQRAEKSGGRTIHTPQEIEQAIRSTHKGEITYANAAVYAAGDWCTIAWVRGDKHDYTAYIIDPYTNNVERTVKSSKSFWTLIKMIHVSLLLPKYGREVVGISTLLFFIVLITGIYLWRPKTKKAAKAALTIKTNASLKRINYDLHRTLGFYATLPLIFIALTGLIFAFQWMDKGAYSFISDTPHPERVTAEVHALERMTFNDPFEAFEAIKATQPPLYQYTITLPNKRSANYQYAFFPERLKGLNNFDTYVVEAKDGKLVSYELWSQLSTKQKLKRAEYNIHVGAIGGIYTKVIAFIACLIAASLPITGFFMWRNKQQRGRKQR